ncbi:MAG: hypothetical protein E3J21_19160 [Anaerolineales bacterium]|nr:MAG: hypothetical protein E3J21_19160 [Anaerolineales bacterium]
MSGAVIQLHGQLAAGANPSFVCLPYVDVLIGRGVVGQAARSSRRGLLDEVRRGRCITGDRLRYREARVKDVQALVAVQAELDGDSPPRLDTVQRRSAR